MFDDSLNDQGGSSLECSVHVCCHCCVLHGLQQQLLAALHRSIVGRWC